VVKRTTRNKSEKTKKRLNENKRREEKGEGKRRIKNKCIHIFLWPPHTDIICKTVISFHDVGLILLKQFYNFRYCSDFRVQEVYAELKPKIPNSDCA
jgi:hypothetical protein